MDPNTYSEWHKGVPSPVIFYTEDESSDLINTNKSIAEISLDDTKSTADAIKNEERVLILTPLKDAALYLRKYFELISALSYPHHLIDLAFLISDTTDETLGVLAVELERIQTGNVPFNRVSVFSKDFGYSLDNLDVEQRHAFAAQGPRRRAMAKARNYLLTAALKPEHSWVLWRDVDIVDSPPTIIEDLINHDTDIIVPNIWFHRYDDEGKDIEGRFDYNSWVDTAQTVALVNTLDRETILVEGYKEYETGREYMCRLGDWRRNKDEELELDGIGGVNIVVKADVHRSGINFPAYAFENQCETEGFAKMAKRAGFRVVGLPNYVVWHIDTDEKAGNN
ncbi:hypothetical protein DV451_000313 [Geotrichum candidum]|uniref:Mannan polymerase II complex ANP1 subunit n=2 Tax=Geotrichum candidum TaxID=1173061 RepID=A0A9P5GAV6_GEOCN|nr:hypothetical protein DV451_000313 [Geotrichum candidum]KAF5108688.1 hypothetical protein DV453_002079 [Geotrichum candidum]